MVTSTRIVAFAATVLAAITLFGVVGAPSAQAWLRGGRYVYRSCGTNSIDSAPYYAETRKHDGGCAGRLSAAMRHSNGLAGPRAYGSATYAVARGASGDVGGYHWGCDSCGQSTT
jgi:hypothetical protein